MRGFQVSRHLNRARRTPSSSSSSIRGIHTTATLNSWKTFASVDPWELSDTKQHTVSNLVGGKWSNSDKKQVLPDPLTGKIFMHVSDVQVNEIESYVASLATCTKSGLHNPLKDPQRYLKFGDISARAASKMRDPEVAAFFARLIQRVAPKSDFQAMGEVSVTQKFIENFGGDQVRFLAKSFAMPGDHQGQISAGYRWPYGPVTIIAPFNFPLEIPLLQLMGALYMGNKVLLKAESKVSVVMEQALRLLHECGLPLTDVDFINCQGPVMHKLLLEAKPRMTLFTGSTKVAEILARDLHGRIKLEDAGWDWKILGPDVMEEEYVAYTSDQDAYAYSGQKCSAQSALFVHENWSKAGFVDRLAALAERRKLSDMTVGPVLTVTNETFLSHIKDLLTIPGTSIAFGGTLIPPETHNIPPCYGSWVPTAVKIPLKELLKPGAPQNHWFGPAGDPRAAGIGTPEAIKMVWSCHREIITDEGPIAEGWKTPESS